MNPETLQSGPMDSHQKAFQINMDKTRYGTFAEIGAGQEVARTFFRAGGAAGTVAKTISAYDMTFSDAIYGTCDRYVSRQRLQTMLDYEFALLRERLNAKKGADTLFFVFADTVAAKSFSRQTDAHGWMGIQFQTEPLGAPSQILIHVRMYDKENVQQQEALGTIGVNLIHGAAYYHQEPKRLIHALVDNLGIQRVEVDTVKFSGPVFKNVDNRLMSLQLVEHGLTNAALLTPNGDVVQPGELLYGKPILIERGSFHPVNLLHLDMLEQACKQFKEEPNVSGNEVVELMEMTMRNITSTGPVDHDDFLSRADLLGALGKTVVVSNYAHFYRLAAHLAAYTKRMIGFATGVPTLKEIFQEKYYTNLDGGILESFGRLFKNAVKLYVYPSREAQGSLITAQTLAVAPNLRHLYAHLFENRNIECIRSYNDSLLPLKWNDLPGMIQRGEPGWESMVPAPVAQLIKDRGFYNKSQKN